MLTLDDILIVYPLFKHNFLLSSSKLFIDYIHILSTGPSKSTQSLKYQFGNYVSSFLNYYWFILYSTKSLRTLDAIPSCQSPDLG